MARTKQRPPRKPPKEQSTSTQESQAPNNEATSNDKSNNSSNSTLPTVRSQTSQVESIGNDLVLKPYWTAQVAEWSRRLWLPTETDSVGLRSSSSNTSSVSTIPRSSWYTQGTTHRPRYLPQRNSLRTSSQSTLFSYVDCKDDDQQKTESKENKGGTIQSKKRKAGSILKHTRKKKKWRVLRGVSK